MSAPALTRSRAILTALRVIWRWVSVLISFLTVLASSVKSFIHSSIAKSELRNDMRWWFSASDHQVQIVLLAKFEHTSRAIILEKWEEATG
ncbi:hypothetical protein C8A00DRAFT_19625 [Chaetomidium leptoderma]|uniref:Uncharacterized protein n=1 Tax=Chaetomidium leptoderma TaxID=669021 RepID=A0AAN6VBV8_9PEZI|nr:hypothetical protein C8A00DRAFT_19625 [Chaetomidium leptoderma]